MEHGKIGRRRALTLLGVATAVTATATAVAHEAASPVPGAGTAPGAPVLPAQLESGADGYRVAAIGPVTHGAFSLRLENDSGDSFLVEVCARDDSPGALRGPARTQRFDLFLANLGEGDTPTREAHGLAAMAFATALSQHEHEIDVSGLLTLRERHAQHAGTMMSMVIPRPSPAP